MSGAADATLDRRLLAAHAQNDRAALVALYAEAASRRDAAGNASAAAFYRTHAYVFALERGEACAADLRAALVAAGRET